MKNVFPWLFALTLCTAFVVLQGCPSAGLSTNSGTQTISVSSGNNQAGPAGTALAGSLVVKITDSGSNPVSGVTVSWAVGTGGGSVGSPSSVSDSGGLASTTATLGAPGGSNTYTAAASGLTGSPVVFNASGATTMTLSSGNGQAGAAGTALASPLTVKVTDLALNPIAGITVTWAAASGGGSVSAPPSVTNSSGLASTTATLGAAGGGNTYSATVVGLKNSPLSFSATAATNMALSAGNGQRSKVGTPLTNPLVVIVTLVTGAPVQGVTVTWAATVGAGSVGSPTSVTDVNGLAQTTATPGALGASANQFTATVTGLTGSPVTFTEGGL